MEVAEQIYSPLIEVAKQNNSPLMSHHPLAPTAYVFACIEELRGHGVTDGDGGTRVGSGAA